uniref:Neurotransmitter-gated ion-channel transmembrane domain-containing protein n=1 Tax=Meloidogyne enterolobii TaxID=390850 RepID=A0A6V7UXT9_MELEN|nr:unnamed protein product [Meloidogyne enterolobii]
MPPTSLEVPMFGQYLITTMILVALSTLFSVASVNIRFRNGSTHQMSPWIRIVFLGVLPKILLMKRPERQQLETNTNSLDNFMGEKRQGLEPSSSSSSFNFEYSNKKATISSPSNLFNNRSKLPQTSIVNKNKKEKYDKPPHILPLQQQILIKILIKIIIQKKKIFWKKIFMQNLLQVEKYSNNFVAIKVKN